MGSPSSSPVSPLPTLPLFSHTVHDRWSSRIAAVGGGASEGERATCNAALIMDDFVIQQIWRDMLILVSSLSHNHGIKRCFDIKCDR